MSSADSNEKQKQQSSESEPRPFGHSFNDAHPGYRQSRSTYFKIMLLNVGMITLTIWCILPIYWGALWRPNNGVHNLNGWIVDFDGGPMGQIVTQSFLNATGLKGNLNWRVVDPSIFERGTTDLPDLLVDERAWAIISVNPGATQRLQAAIANRDSTYNSSGAVTAYAVEARNENAYRNYILPQMQQGLTQAMGAFALQNAQQLGAQAGSVLTTAPTTVLSPMNYTIANVRPFDIQVATAVDFVGLIYLLILTFIAAQASYTARNMETQLEKQMMLKHLLPFRIVVPFLVYFWLSLAFTLLSQFFLVPFNRRFHAAGFLIQWMLEYVGMLALGLALEAVLTIVTPKFISFFLVLWIIANVSVTYYPIEILPTIYRYGYAMPFYNVQRATRTVLFSTRNQVGMNFGILLCWIAASLITIPLAQLFVSKRAMREERKKQESQPQHNDEHKDQSRSKPEHGRQDVNDSGNGNASGDADVVDAADAGSRDSERTRR